MGAVEIAAALAASRRAVRLYPPEHPTHRDALNNLCRIVNAAVDVRPLMLNLRDGRLYEGSEVLTEASPATRALAEAMESRRVESLTFHMGFGETDGEGLSEVLGLRPSPDLSVIEELEARGVRAVTVSELEDNSAEEIEARDRRREADRSLYRGILTAFGNLEACIGEDAPIDGFEITRTVAPLIERAADNPHAVLALATMTGHGNQLRFHSANVMLRALVIGHAIGLSDKELLDLGVAALLHDVGHLPTIAGGATSTERSHPETGARTLGSMPGDDCCSVFVAYEHHIGVDGSGWPEVPADYIIHPYGRIVAVADRYDRLIRPARGEKVTPGLAIAQVMREASGGPLDPVMTRLFVQLIGCIPVGSVARLTDHSVGVVHSPGDDPLNPRLRLILAPDGIEMRPPIDVDLSQDGRAIVEIIDDRVLGMHPADHL